MNLSQLIEYLSEDQDFQKNITKWTVINERCRFF